MDEHSGYICGINYAPDAVTANITIAGSRMTALAGNGAEGMRLTAVVGNKPENGQLTVGGNDGVILKYDL